jgi:hypothetical protein
MLPAFGALAKPTPTNRAWRHKNAEKTVVFTEIYVSEVDVARFVPGELTLPLSENRGVRMS